MFFDRRISRLPLLALLAVGAACSDSKGGPTDPGSIPSGSLSFAYGGDLAGSFSVSGAPRRDQGEGGNWAAAVRDDDGALVVYASKNRSGARYDFVSVILPVATPGSYPLSDDCDDDCAAVAVFFNLEKGEDADFDYSCYLEEGMINLQSVTGGRARGTFSGVGTCYSLDGEDVVLADVEITGGTFDTAVIVDMS